MKVFTSICFVLALVCVAFFYIGDYQIGYYGKSYVPDGLGVFLWWVLLIFVLIGAWFVAVQRQVALGWVTTLLMGSILPFFILPAPADMMAYGLRDAVMKDHNPEDLRELARKIDMGMNLRDEDIVSTNQGMTESQKRLYAQLAAWYSFLHRAPSVQDPDLLYSKGRILKIMWGGGFGHWGLCVALNGHKTDINSIPHEKDVPVSDDIYFFSGG